MSHVTCTRCGETREGVSGVIPFRGELKEKVATSICGPCWEEWREEQVRVINELALNLGDSRSHQIIEQKATEFLGFGEGPAEPSTGTPPDPEQVH